MKKTFRKTSASHPHPQDAGRTIWKSGLFALLFMVVSTFSFGQAFNVKGVLTSETGETLPGASVILKGTSTGTTTDAEGKYSLNLPDSKGTLVFTYIGYVAQEVAVANKSQIDVQLLTNDKTLEEVVVVGYGTQK